MTQANAELAKRQQKAQDFGRDLFVLERELINYRTSNDFARALILETWKEEFQTITQNLRDVKSDEDRYETLKKLAIAAERLKFVDLLTLQETKKPFPVLGDYRNLPKFLKEKATKENLYESLDKYFKFEEAPNNQATLTYLVHPSGIPAVVWKTLAQAQSTYLMNNVPNFKTGVEVGKFKEKMESFGEQEIGYNAMFYGNQGFWNYKNTATDKIYIQKDGKVTFVTGPTSVPDAAADAKYPKYLRSVGGMLDMPEKFHHKTLLTTEDFSELDVDRRTALNKIYENVLVEFIEEQCADLYKNVVLYAPVEKEAFQTKIQDLLGKDKNEDLDVIKNELFADENYKNATTAGALKLIVEKFNSLIKDEKNDLRKAQLLELRAKVQHEPLKGTKFYNDMLDRIQKNSFCVRMPQLCDVRKLSGQQTSFQLCLDIDLVQEFVDYDFKTTDYADSTDKITPDSLKPGDDVAGGKYHDLSYMEIMSRDTPIEFSHRSNAIIALMVKDQAMQETALFNKKHNDQYQQLRQQYLNQFDKLSNEVRLKLPLEKHVEESRWQGEWISIEERFGSFLDKEKLPGDTSVQESAAKTAKAFEDFRGNLSEARKVAPKEAMDALAQTASFLDKLDNIEQASITPDEKQKATADACVDFTKLAQKMTYQTAPGMQKLGRSLISVAIGVALVAGVIIVAGFGLQAAPFLDSATKAVVNEAFKAFALPVFYGAIGAAGGFGVAGTVALFQNKKETKLGESMEELKNNVSPSKKN